MVEVDIVPPVGGSYIWCEANHVRELKDFTNSKKKILAFFFQLSFLTIIC